MDIARERRVLELYETVADWPAAARDARLAALASDDPAILDAVRAMIRAGDGTALLDTISSEPIDAAPEIIPERIGAYRIAGELGRGGMGTVFLGERDDGLFEQKVAIKVIRHGLFSPAALEQFAIERRILARLHHPHIAQLLDGGVTEDGASYIVMELLEGAPITDFAAAHRLGVAARLALFTEACGAIEHAHRNLVVHSDIKPSNVLATDDFGVKLLDFGIARLLNRTDGVDLRAHTPGYGSPAQRDGLPPSPADDVHALGALMQALLADQAIDTDLAAVAARAAAADAKHRYGAVSELLADIERWRAHRPVSARKAEPLHRALLYWRRHRLSISIVLAAFMLLATATAISTTLYFRATTAQEAAERRFEQTRRLSQYLIDDVTRDLAPLPGSGPIRRRIAQRGNMTLEELSRVPGAPPRLRAESANGFWRVGTILAGAGATQNLDLRDADNALNRAVAELRRLHAADPDNFQIAVALARARVSRAEFLTQSKNDQAGAARTLDIADRDLAMLSARFPRSAAVATAEWDSALARAAIRDVQGQFAANLAPLRAVIARFPALPLPRDAERALRIDRGWTLLASAEWYLGSRVAALASSREAMRSLDDPALRTDARVVTRQGYAAFNIASTLGEAGDHEAALAAIEPGVAAAARLRTFDASPQARNMENIVRLEHAVHLAAVGRFDDAVEEGRRSITGRRALAAMQPDNYLAARSVPVGLRPLAEIYQSGGRHADACVSFAMADQAWSAIAAHRKLSDFDAGEERKIVRKGLAQCPVAARQGSSRLNLSAR